MQNLKILTFTQVCVLYKMKCAHGKKCEVCDRRCICTGKYSHITASFWKKQKIFKEPDTFFIYAAAFFFLQAHVYYVVVKRSEIW